MQRLTVLKIQLIPDLLVKVKLHQLLRKTSPDHTITVSDRLYRLVKGKLRFPSDTLNLRSAARTTYRPRG